MEPPRMTAREWDDEQDPIVLLDILYPMRGLDSTEQQTRASRMYLLACARRVWERLPLVSRVILEMAEPIAERETVEEAVRDAVRQLAENLTHCRGEEDELRELERRLKLIDWPQDRRARETRSFDPTTWTALAHLVYFPFASTTPHYRRITPEFHSLELLRDVFGNPIRKIAFDPTWLDQNVSGIARGMYVNRDFSPMPVLADALQDAGCENTHIIEHCQSGCEHVRGCWVIDGLLRKRSGHPPRG